MSNLIRGYCHTNLDQWKRATWPTMFVALPRVGDRVRGKLGQFEPWLKVISVTHEMHDGGPRVCVELHNG